MGWFSRKPPSRFADAPSDLAVRHLEQFAHTRLGVEAYVEPETNVTAMTMVLIAYDGEWTRRIVGTPRQAAKLAGRLGVPIYDVAAVGYPARMREWTRRQKESSQGG